MSGKSIKSVPCDRINRKDVHVVVCEIFTKYLEPLGLTPCDVALVGSTGKNPTSGDIDLAVNLEPLYRHYNTRDIRIAVKDLKDDIPVDEKYLYFGNQITFPYSYINYRDELKHVQVDLMLTPSLEAASFYYYAPADGLSKYDAGARNDLMMAIAIHHERRDLGNGVEERYWFDRFGGLVKGKEHQKPRYGFDKMSVTTNPDDITKILIGGMYDANSIETFENLWDIVTSDQFVGKDHLKDIRETFIGIRLNRDKIVPPEAA